MDLVSQRARILRLALELMARGGAEAMSMRDLAAAAGMNVATLYHYFPSKRDLLTAVLEEPGYREILDSALPTGAGDLVEDLALLLEQSWRVMLDVQDYVRVMIGETLRGDDAARTVGSGLLDNTGDALQAWVREVLDEDDPERVAAIARVLRAVIVGVFIEQLADDQDGPDWTAQRARDLARALTALGVRPRASGRRRPH